MRKGLKGRTPIEYVPRATIEQRYKDFVGIIAKPYEPDKEFRILADALQLTGISRIGKSTAVDLSLSYNPQVIDHIEYKGRPMLQTQLVYLNTTCPEKGRVKSLCENVLTIADFVCGTDYCTNYVQKGRAGLEHLLMGLYDLTSTSALGILVVDEIQLLAGVIAAERRIKDEPTATQRSKLTDELLNVLVGLDNTLGVPVVYVGTPLAKKVFATHFRSLARANRLGSFDWDFVARTSKQWKEFVTALATLQYIKEQIPVDELLEVLYDCSAGIAGIAVMVFRAAQKYLLENENERLTKDVITTVFKSRFSQFQKPINALINGEHTSLMTNWEDLVTADFSDNGQMLEYTEDYTEEERAEIEGSKMQPPSPPVMALPPPKNDSKSQPTEGRKPKKAKAIDQTELQQFIDKHENEPLDE